MKCKNCGEPITKEMIFCGNCGWKILLEEDREYRCAECGSVIDVDDAFCGECGAPINKSSEMNFSGSDVFGATVENESICGDTDVAVNDGVEGTIAVREPSEEITFEMPGTVSTEDSVKSDTDAVRAKGKLKSTLSFKSIAADTEKYSEGKRFLSPARDFE